MDDAIKNEAAAKAALVRYALELNEEQAKELLELGGWLRLIKIPSVRTSILVMTRKLTEIESKGLKTPDELEQMALESIGQHLRERERKAERTQSAA